MQIQVASERHPDADTLLILLSPDDEINPSSMLPESLYSAMKKRGDFTGKYKETCVVYEKNHRIVLMGMGDPKELNPEKMRILASACMKQLAHVKKCKIAVLEMPESLNQKEQIAFAEGLFLSRYRFEAYKSQESQLEEVDLLFVSKGLKQAFDDLEIVSRGVDYARDLVNLNADTVNPTYLVQEAISLAAKHPEIKTTVLRKKELENLKAGLILAVSRGAEDEPALIIMEYNGLADSKEKPIAFVGKGITFDTGGLNLKPTGSIETMKCDMAGAACVFGVMKAAAEMKLKKHFICAVASCENAIGPMCYRPGDVIKSLNGKTVEINNTDAEGRLVLSDAITYLQRYMGVKQIIDLATLTGAITIALGEEAAGLFTKSKSLEEKLLKAADITGEKVWPMPLYDEFKDQLKSKIADMKNSGKRLGGASTGALFIEAFVEEGTEWAHLDIAGVAYLSEPRTYHSTLATGFGVRLLLNLLGV